MTREEAIKELKEDIELYTPLHGTIDDVDRDLPDGRLITALEMGIKALEQEPCEDAISRQAVIDSLHSKFADGFDSDRWWNSKSVLYAINKVPPVNPQEPKTGHWIISPNDYFATCSECGLHGDKGIYKHYGWCPSCGAKMVEPQETETWNGYHGQITAPKGTFERIFNDADDDNDI